MKYFVLDQPFVGLRPWDVALRPYLAANWIQEATIGDYLVYRNPAFPNDAILSRDDNLADLAHVQVALEDHLVVRNDAIEKVSGENSLRVDLDLKEEHILYVYDLAEAEDWSSIEGLSFWWYGDRMGQITLGLVASEEGDFYRLGFEDDWRGWRQVRLSLAEATPVGNPSWKTINELTLRFQKLPASGTVRLDDLRLHPKASYGLGKKP